MWNSVLSRLLYVYIFASALYVLDVKCIFNATLFTDKLLSVNPFPVILITKSLSAINNYKS